MSIFLEGKCLKSELFNRIIEIMESAGWKNISSNPATEDAVMYSTGETGDKELVFQIRPRAVAGTVATDIQTTTANMMSYRLINGYVPNEATGTNGTFERPTEAWKNLYITPAVVAQTVELSYLYTVNKNRIIFITYTPQSLNLLPCMFYIGLPTHYTSEPKSKGLVALTSFTSLYSNTVHISDDVAELPTSLASTTATNIFALPPKSPNSAGIHTPFECMFGNASVGIRGKLDSIYFLPLNSINDGDILRFGAKRYRAVNLAVSGNNSFPTPTLIVQIS